MDQIYDNGMLYILQAMTQSQQTTPAVNPSKSDESASFQKLMEQKTQQAKEENPAPETPEAPKAEAEVKQESVPQKETEGEDPMQTQLAAAQLVAPQFQAVDATQTPEPEELAELDLLPVEKDSQVMIPLDRAVAENSGMLVRAEPTGQPELQAQAGEHFQPQTQPQAQEQVQPQEQTQSVEVEPPKQTVQAAAPEQNARQQDAAQSQTEQPKSDLPQAVADSEVKVDVEEAGAEAQPLFRDLEAPPVKVGEAQATQQSQKAPAVEDQIADKLTQALSQGESKVAITLTPESLGTVTVEITRQENGALQIVLAAENSQTRGLLERNVADLQALLNVRTQESVQVEVQRSQEGQQHAADYDGHNGREDAQQQEQRRPHERDSQDFMQQLRLGLIPLDEVS